MILRQIISNIVKYLLIFQIVVIAQLLMGDEVEDLHKESGSFCQKNSNNADNFIVYCDKNDNIDRNVIASSFYASYWRTDFNAKENWNSVSMLHLPELNWVLDFLSNATKISFNARSRFQLKLMKSFKYDAVCPIIIFSPKIIIKQDGIDISNTIHDEIVGRKINLSVEVLPEDLNIENIHWTIPGVRVKNYIYTKQKSTLIKVGTGELNSYSISYYWVSGGVQQVECAVEVNGKSYKGKARFNVKRPTAIMASMTGKVGINSCLSSLLLSYETPRSHGFYIMANAFCPIGFGGRFQFIQIAEKWLRRIRLNNGDWYRHSGIKLFDTVARYPQYDDSPAMELLSTFDKAEVSDSFESYLMFRPNGKNSIWVPLLVIKNLSWYAKATRKSGGIWFLEHCKNKFNPRCSYTTDFPEWNGNILSIQWVKE